MLRTVYSEDYPYLRHLEFDQPDSALYRHRGMSVSPETYPASLWHGVLSQFMVCDATDGQPVGIVSCFAADMRNQHARLAVLIDPVVRGHGWPNEGMTLFIDYLFATFPLRKLYADVLEPNLQTFQSGIEEFAVLEGHFADHEYLNGGYVDLLTYSIRREDWSQWVTQRKQDLRSLVTRPNPSEP